MCVCKSIVHNLVLIGFNQQNSLQLCCGVIHTFTTCGVCHFELDSELFVFQSI